MPKVGDLQRGSWELKALNFLVSYCARERIRYNNKECRDEFVIVDYGLNDNSQLEIDTGYVDEEGNLSKNWVTNYFDLNRDGLEFALRYLGLDF